MSVLDKRVDLPSPDALRVGGVAIDAEPTPSRLLQLGSGLSVAVGASQEHAAEVGCDDAIPRPMVVSEKLNQARVFSVAGECAAVAYDPTNRIRASRVEIGRASCRERV